MSTVQKIIQQNSAKQNSNTYLRHAKYAPNFKSNDPKVPTDIIIIILSLLSIFHILSHGQS